MMQRPDSQTSKLCKLSSFPDAFVHLHRHYSPQEQTVSYDVTSYARRIFSPQRTQRKTRSGISPYSLWLDFFELVNTGREAYGKALVNQFVIRATGFAASKAKGAGRVTEKRHTAH